MTKKRNDKELKQIEEAQDEGMPSLAVELSNRYTATYPDDIEGLYYKATALYSLGRYAEAKQQLEAIIPHLSNDLLGAAYTYLARMSKETGKLSEASRHYCKAMEIDPEDSDNYVELGLLLLHLDRTADAEKVALKGIKADASPIADLYVLLGLLLRTKGEIVKSAEAFQRVLKEAENEIAEAAIEDLKETAALKGIEFPALEDLSNDESESESEQGEKEPGKMTMNIEREFFEAILKGDKKIEYRDNKDYWTKRIEKAGEPPFHLRIINGMLPPAPELTVVVEKVCLNMWTDQYELNLGEIVEVKNWNAESEATEE